MACDSLRAAGISTDVKAWNLPIDGDAAKVVGMPGAADCDIIFGPLYTPQVKQMADFCKQKGIKLVIPFSISSDEGMNQGCEKRISIEASEQGCVSE